MNDVQVTQLESEKCTFGTGGTLELNLGSSIKVQKGDNEAKIVVVGENDTEHELTFPEKTGTLAIAAPNPTAGNLAALDA